jgi:outer membrane immunogenic protein
MRGGSVFGAAVGLFTILAGTGALAQPVYNWTGPYLGVSGGFGWGHSDQTDPGLPPVGGAPQTAPQDGSYSLNGGVFGGGAGMNWQFGPWVYGLEGDYSWADISGSSDGCGAAFIPHTCSTKLESLGTVRGRIGYAVGWQGNWLLYATGGLAVGELQASDSLFNVSGSDFRAGWTVGAGVETAFWRNWTVKAEYLYVDLGKAVLFDIVPGVPETVSFTAHVFRVGLNYKFDWGSPPFVARR